jgi:hypothetical protein
VPWYALLLALSAGLVLIALPGTLINAAGRVVSGVAAEILGAGAAGVLFGTAAFALAAAWPGRALLWSVLVASPTAAVLLGWLALSSSRAAGAALGIGVTLTVCVGLALYGGHLGSRWRTRRRPTSEPTTTGDSTDCPAGTRAWVAADEAPEHLRDLLDPEQTLRASQVFLPSDSGSLFYVVHNGIWIVVLGMLSLTSMLDLVRSLAGTETPPLLPPWLAGTIAAACGAGAVLVARGLGRALRVRRRQREGRHREGLFVLDDAVLVHRRGRVFVAPREHIVRAHFRWRKGDASIAELHVRDSRGVLIAIDINFLQRHGSDVVPWMQHWIDTGDWPGSARR